MKILRILLLLLLFVTNVFAQIEVMDFDQTLPAEGTAWPNIGGNNWDNWELFSSSYYESGIYYDSSGLSTTVYHSSPRSLRVTRKNGYYGVVDIYYDFPESYETLYIDYWVYFDTQGFGSNPGYNIPYDADGLNVHFLMLNTAVAPTPASIDLTQYTNARGWPPTCLDETNGGAYFGMGSSDYNGSDQKEFYGSSIDTDCWNVTDHLDTWVNIRHCWKLGSIDSAYTWIDSTLIISTDYQNYDISNFTRLIVSGWVSQNAQNDFDATFYIDDIQIDTTTANFGDLNVGEGSAATTKTANCDSVWVAN